MKKTYQSGQQVVHKIGAISLIEDIELICEDEKKVGTQKALFESYRKYLSKGKDQA